MMVGMMVKAALPLATAAGCWWGWWLAGWWPAALLLWCVIPYKNETLGAPTHVYKVMHEKGYAARIRDGRTPARTCSASRSLKDVTEPPHFAHAPPPACSKPIEWPTGLAMPYVHALHSKT